MPARRTVGTGQRLTRTSAVTDSCSSRIVEMEKHSVKREDSSWGGQQIDPADPSRQVAGRYFQIQDTSCRERRLSFWQLLDRFRTPT